MLYRIVNDGTLDIGPKRTVFVLTALAMLNVTLGLNYTPIRFLTAPFLLLLLHAAVARVSCFDTPRRILIPALTAGVSSIFVWAISPEAGIAYSAAAALFLFISAWQRDWRIAFIIPFCPIGFLAAVGLFGREYMSAVLDFSSGLGNFLIVPAPYMVFFLITLVCIVPVGVAMAARENPCRIPILFSFLALGLAYVKPALGRCDPGHVLWNGLCIFLLGFSVVARYYSKFQRTYLLCFGLLFVIGHQLGVDLTYRRQLQNLTTRREEAARDFSFSLEGLKSTLWQRPFRWTNERRCTFPAKTNWLTTDSCKCRFGTGRL
jgi:hypothetical protein